MKRLCCESFLLGLIALLTISIIVGAASDSVPVQRNSAQRPPNFIVLMGEGQGWNSTSVQMDDAMPASKSNFVQTPNLERLAREGMRFANAY
ncbi:MAG TPA: hypothetical protein PK012_33055, partial [Blastocatellia bacterium]|nr:hypothetical protein [Blastocatellia bacterium]